MDKLPREAYYDLIKEHTLYDILDKIPELSYTEKGNIIKEMVDRFGVVVLNRALIMYDTNYIRVHKVDVRIIKKVLIGLCGRVLNQA